MNIKLISKKCWEGRFITCPISKNVLPPKNNTPRKKQSSLLGR